MSKITNWFDGRKFTPSQPGVYVRRISSLHNNIYWSYWNGSCWYCLISTFEKCGPYNSTSIHQNLDWYGLASDPSYPTGKAVIGD